MKLSSPGVNYTMCIYSYTDQTYNIACTYKYVYIQGCQKFQEMPKSYKQQTTHIIPTASEG